jgi:2-polyprenyl-3-methyl-5-hydroxy-6-metoxy-1,4-benzoquinol methylase
VTAATALGQRQAAGLLVDVGCGTGRLRDFTRGFASDYIGVDVVRHPQLPPDVTFLHADLDRDPVPVPTGSAGIVTALETVEHLENPRAFVRELVRVLRPGGWMVVTTPNQLSARSLLSLVTRGHFAEFHGSCYPAHLTALLPVDLERIAAECGLEHAQLELTADGRVPLSSLRYPRFLSRLFPSSLSDHVALVARKRA